MKFINMKNMAVYGHLIIPTFKGLVFSCVLSEWNVHFCLTIFTMVTSKHMYNVYTHYCLTLQINKHEMNNITA